jgi:hypothetical protein
MDILICSFFNLCVNGCVSGLFDVEMTRRGQGGAEIKSVSRRYKLTETHGWE